MMRLIVTPASLPAAALAALKDWLGITVSADDASLGVLLRASLDLCAEFTGMMPLACTVEENLPLGTDWQSLTTRPVLAITGVDGIALDGTRAALGLASYDSEIAADGTARVRIHDGGALTRVAVRFSAGLAPDWDHLPEPLRHGVIRLAAHQYRSRETPGAEPLPPASVAALWRPWRRLRLA
ncbi:MAG: hypothetical protein JSS36_11640 [Proteobacteria bacterium]|nr:hypothetical protein [Pseudomonadota bacterium]